MYKHHPVLRVCSIGPVYLRLNRVHDRFVSVRDPSLRTPFLQTPYNLHELPGPHRLMVVKLLNHRKLRRIQLYGGGVNRGEDD